MPRPRWLALTLLLLGACGGEPTGDAPAADALAASWRLPAEPPGARAVREVRASAAQDEPVVVVGRAADFVDGLAAFTLVDEALPDCSRGGPMPDCPTPWDYCCTDPAEVAAHTVVVELRDGGQVLRAPVRGFLGLDHLSRVVVSGSVRRDAAGNVTLLASGLLPLP
jgi:hypothetical protein